MSEHVLYQLEQIKPLFSRVILISNSRLEKNYMRKLEIIGITEIIQRANIGFDFAAWRDGMDYVGFDHLEKYDSVTLMNDTCIGPLWPLEPYFRSFESAIDCDFWGMTNFKKTKYFREHVQSYFVSYSREVVSSKVFKSFWMNVKSYDNVRQVIDNYETKFTSELKRTGFNYQVVFNTLGEKSDDMLHPDFSYYRPFDILNHRVPFLKIKALQSHQEQANLLETRIKKDLEDTRKHQFDNFIPYIQLHEFEALVFASINGIDSLFERSEMDYKGLMNVIQQYPNPEDINNHPDTAPSVRLKKLISGYNKVLHGIDIINTVGMNELLEKCPRFKAWIESMEEVLK